MSKVNECKFISQKNKDLLNGYIREIQALFSANLVYFNIPPSINQLCTLYYTIRGYFNTELCAKDLMFNDEKTVTKINCDSHALCLFGEPITDKMCKVFRIEFTIKEKGLCGALNDEKTQNKTTLRLITRTKKKLREIEVLEFKHKSGVELHPVQIAKMNRKDELTQKYEQLKNGTFGFATSSSISELMASLKLIRDWNIDNAKFRLKDGSSGPAYSISMYNGDTHFKWNGSNKIATAQQQMDVNDTFMFVHSFEKSKCIAYHNNNRIHEFSMDAKCIIPTLSMYYEGEQIEVTKYEFE